MIHLFHLFVFDDAILPLLLAGFANVTSHGSLSAELGRRGPKMGVGRGKGTCVCLSVLAYIDPGLGLGYVQDFRTGRMDVEETGHAVLLLVLNLLAFLGYKLDSAY